MSWLVLTGFMGVGKTVGGRMLAQHVGCEFVDSDALIEEQADLPIPRIFATKGELWFRRMEERVIRDVLARTPVGVLSIGGGAVESAKTRSLLQRSADVVYLRAAPEELWTYARGTDRPLAADEAMFMRRYARREPFYDEVADLTVHVDRSRDELVGEVAAWWAARG